MITEAEQLILISDLQNLSDHFSLPCIVREDEVTIIGTLKLLVFKRQEKNTCQLIQII